MPDYPLWTAAVSLAEQFIIFVMKKQIGNLIDDIKSKITKHAIVTNPNNPTGALYPKEVRRHC